MRNLYQKFCRSVEDIFYREGSNHIFYLWIFISIIEMSVLLFIAKRIDERFPYSLSPIFICFFSIYLVIWLFLRAVHACDRKEREKKNRDHIRNAPLNWKRFSVTANKSAPVLDFEVYDRDTIYKTLTPWQQVMGDKDFLIKKLKPLGWDFQEFQTNYNKRCGTFDDYNFYFKKDKRYLCVLSYSGGYLLQMKQLQKIDEVAEIGIYKDVEVDNREIEKINKCLKGDQYG